MDGLMESEVTAGTRGTPMPRFRDETPVPGSPSPGTEPLSTASRAEAWEQFYSYCFAVVHQCPSVRRLPATDREDCVQDVMFELVKKFGDDLPETIRENHTGLIRTLSRNKAVDILRRRFTRSASSLDDRASGVPAPETAPGTGESVSLVWEALLSLDQKVPVTSYLVFYLRTIEEWEVEEIADLFGLTADQVRSRCHRVRGMFNEALKRRAT
jgi:RNA polymerase sigma factor (sigma-70 family)